MKHNFSRELACFTLAQDIIESTLQIGEKEIVAYHITGECISNHFNSRIGRAATIEETVSIVQAMTELGDSLHRDCSTFSLAHYIFHIVED